MIRHLAAKVVKRSLIRGCDWSMSDGEIGQSDDDTIIKSATGDE